MQCSKRHDTWYILQDVPKKFAHCFETITQAPPARKFLFTPLYFSQCFKFVYDRTTTELDRKCCNRSFNTKRYRAVGSDSIGCKLQESGWADVKSVVCDASVRRLETVQQKLVVSRGIWRSRVRPAWRRNETSSTYCVCEPALHTVAVCSRRRKLSAQKLGIYRRRSALYGKFAHAS